MYVGLRISPVVRKVDSIAKLTTRYVGALEN